MKTKKNTSFAILFTIAALSLAVLGVFGVDAHLGKTQLIAQRRLSGGTTPTVITSSEGVTSLNLSNFTITEVSTTKWSGGPVKGIAVYAGNYVNGLASYASDTPCLYIDSNQKVYEPDGTANPPLFDGQATCNGYLAVGPLHDASGATTSYNFDSWRISLSGHYAPRTSFTTFDIQIVANPSTSWLPGTNDPNTISDGLRYYVATNANAYHCRADHWYADKKLQSPQGPPWVYIDNDPSGCDLKLVDALVAAHRSGTGSTVAAMCDNGTCEGPENENSCPEDCAILERYDYSYFVEGFDDAASEFNLGSVSAGQTKQIRIALANFSALGTGTDTVTLVLKDNGETTNFCTLDKLAPTVTGWTTPLDDQMLGGSGTAVVTLTCTATEALVGDHVLNIAATSAKNTVAGVNAFSTVYVYLNVAATPVTDPKAVTPAVTETPETPTEIVEKKVEETVQPEEKKTDVQKRGAAETENADDDAADQTDGKTAKPAEEKKSLKVRLWGRGDSATEDALGDGGVNARGAAREERVLERQEKITDALDRFETQLETRLGDAVTEEMRTALPKFFNRMGHSLDDVSQVFAEQGREELLGRLASMAESEQNEAVANAIGNSVRNLAFATHAFREQVLERKEHVLAARDSLQDLRDQAAQTSQANAVLELISAKLAAVNFTGTHADAVALYVDDTMSAAQIYGQNIDAASLENLLLKLNAEIDRRIAEDSREQWQRGEIKCYDAPSHEWFFEAVETLPMVRGDTDSNGNPTGTCSPARTFNFAELIAVLHRAFGAEEVKEYSDDVPWFAPAVDAALTNGLITAEEAADETLYGQVSRGAMLDITHRYIQKYQPSFLPDEVDVTVLNALVGAQDQSYLNARTLEFKNMVAFFVSEEVIKGQGGGEFAGQLALSQPVNRAEAFTVFRRLIRDLEMPIATDDL